MIELETDAFIRLPGKVDVRLCEVCDSRCVVTRNIQDPDGFVYDKFVCPHAKEPWHDEVRRLLKRSDKESEGAAYNTWYDAKEIARKHCGPYDKYSERHDYCVEWREKRKRR